MSVVISNFGNMPDGKAVDKVTLTNGNGTAVSVLSYGATIQTLLFGGKDLVLGFDSLEAYFRSDAYIGATIGRFCNRINGGRFTLNGTDYRLACNEAARGAHLHGGNVGFDKKVWDYAVVQQEHPVVCFSMVSEDGEEGYPGRLELSVMFSLTDDDTLSLFYKATCDKDTPINFTNHAYFNLNGCDGADVSTTMLQIAADEYTAVDGNLIPTGEFCSVVGTALDFRTPRQIGETFCSEDPIVSGVGGVDHNFVLSHDRRSLSVAAVAYSPESNIKLTCCTDLPGVQVYTGNSTNENSGKYGCCWGKHQGFCVETQFFPDSVNHSHFPSVILKAGETFASSTTFRFEQIEG